MKTKRILLSLAVLSIVSALPFASGNASFDTEVLALSIPSGTAYKTLSSRQDIDLSDVADSEIRSYYSSIEGQSGTTLLAGLKNVLKKMYYYSYDNVWKIYEITDRDWTLSPASNTTYGTYEEDANQISSYQYGTSNSNGRNNPYVRAVYRNDNESGRVKAWGDHNASGINREHLWPQSRGFKADSGANGPAGTDLHHLLAADGSVNQSYHNNNPYGNVSNPTKSGSDYIEGNIYGISAFDGETSVFEPADQHKGDIARALFYMAARYNNWAGESGAISAYEPFLEITNQAYSVDINGGTVTSSDSVSATMGILHDLLEWHENDPVDEFEIHRNNLIYNNYQANRNPFIDFPEWVTYIWGTSDNVGVPQGSASPEDDVINGYNRSFLDKASLSLNIGEEGTVTSSIDGVIWSIADPSIASFTENGNSVTVKGLKEGTTILSATDQEGQISQCEITVKNPSSSSSDPISSESSSSEVPSSSEIPATSEPTSSEKSSSSQQSSSSDTPSGGLGGCFSSIGGGILASILGTIGIVTIGTIIIARKSRKKEE